MAGRFELLRFAYAHRGLWSTDGPPENSLAAFSAAALAGLGAELDLRRDRTGALWIFHDDTLDRMTGCPGRFERADPDELSQLRLGGTGEIVPRLTDLLTVWPPALPLLCELKVDGATDPQEFAAAAGASLLRYTGLAAAMSFSEAAVRALPADLMRGQLVVPSTFIGKDAAMGIAERAIADGLDYIAVHKQDLPLMAGLAARRNTSIAVWTLRNVAELDSVTTLQPIAPIFEGFDPALARAVLSA